MSTAGPKLRDPLLKLQKRYFSPFYLRPGKQRVKSNVTLGTNLLDLEAKKKAAHHKRHEETLALRRGSEAHWNPESKKRVKMVKSAMIDLRKRRA